MLSPSTESYDRGTKFAHYQKLPSLQEYLLLAQDAPRAELFVRSGEAGDRWLLTTHDGLAGVVPLASVGCELRLAEVYERVEFPPAPPLRAAYEPATAYEAVAG